MVQSLNVVAALDIWTGDIIWRQFLPNNEQIDLIRISSAGAGKMLVSVSGGGKYVRVFSMSTGDLFWDDVTRGGKVAAESPLQPLIRQAPNVMISNQNCVCRSFYQIFHCNRGGANLLRSGCVAPTAALLA